MQTNEYRIDVRGNATDGYGAWVGSAGGPLHHMPFKAFEELKECLTDTLSLPDATLVRVKNALDSKQPYQEMAALDHSVVERFHRRCESRFR